MWVAVWTSGWGYVDIGGHRLGEWCSHEKEHVSGPWTVTVSLWHDSGGGMLFPVPGTRDRDTEKSDEGRGRVSCEYVWLFLWLVKVTGRLPWVGRRSRGVGGLPGYVLVTADELYLCLRKANAAVALWPL